jgi:ATP synthase subunit 6
MPSRYQIGVELVYSFVYDFSYDVLGSHVGKIFTYMFTVFFFILAMNTTGLVPYSISLTGQLIVTFTVGFSSFFGVNFVGIRKHGVHFFSFFLPLGSPLALAPFLVLVELISYVFRLFSLSIRLFANMFAGHTLLTILAGFTVMMAPASFASLSSVTMLASIIPLIVVFGVFILELGIAFLQSYVFTILLCLYMNDALHLH